LMPNFVVTKMNAYADRVMQGGLLFPNAYTYARSAVFTLGKTSETNGFWTHGIQVCTSIDLKHLQIYILSY